MAEEQKITPEQQQLLKRANTAGFIQQLVTDGRPNPDKKGERLPVTVDEASTLFKQAESFWRLVEEQKPHVKDTIRAHLKAKA
jgi:hypothetical protein